MQIHNLHLAYASRCFAFVITCGRVCACVFVVLRMKKVKAFLCVTAHYNCDSVQFCHWSAYKMCSMQYIFKDAKTAISQLNRSTA